MSCFTNSISQNLFCGESNENRSCIKLFVAFAIIGAISVVACALCILFLTGFFNRPEIYSKSWSESTLLNLTHFKWTYNNEFICNTGVPNDSHPEEKLLLIMVNSLRENSNHRVWIRHSVEAMSDSVHKTTEWIVKLIFLIGDAYQPDNSMEVDALSLENAFISEEQKIYNDLVGGNFIDSYDDATYKTMMGFKWAITFCPEAAVVVKMNDYVFFNIPRFVRQRDREMKDLINTTTFDLYCIPEVGMKPFRNGDKINFNQLKYLVSKEEWPEDKLPDYCNGKLYGMTGELLKKVYETAHGVKYFRLEDIFVTGEVMDKVQNVNRRVIEVNEGTDKHIHTICDSAIMRQASSTEVGMVVDLANVNISSEKLMACLTKEVVGR